MRLALRFAVVGLLSGSLLLLTACVGGATPMIKRERGPSGAQLPKNSFDPAFVQPGITTRTEVLSKLSVIDTGVDDSHFFWGRWASSKWGYVVAAGGYGAAAGDARRVWHVHNLLITFSKRGVVQTKQLLDDPPFWRELHKYVATLPPIEVTDPPSFVVNGYGAQRITLAADWVEAERSKGKIRTVRFHPNKILRIKHSGPEDKRNNPGNSCHVFCLDEKTAFGRNLTFCTDGPNLLTTFRYLHKYASPNMQWE